MPARDRALWALAVILSIALLIAPALWNGFALLQYDTGGYLARWYEGTLVPSRAVVYGLILNAGVPLAFWPVLLVQVRAHGLDRRADVARAWAGQAAAAPARRHRRAVDRSPHCPG